ncbi:hypothetical protein SAMN04488104_100612 [Algoriphagus faecimaris]|uniref:Uncharacterized protein n=1 Tax=Algoriphagus faecimaris TaxID=686796 RepID=A0A1G6PF95_9BACT|nr:hypothetical protein [Algoriphagus faecimaris]SDC78900.1 hypothetical protein SAMN04488104_100612 [Algoriphagus faecimaris]
MSEELKVFLKRLWPLYLIVIVIPGLSYLAWYLWPSSTLDLVIIDKTVPNSTYREHNGLFYVLNYQKFIKSSGESYLTDQDYFGFVPNEKADFGSVRGIPASGNELTEWVSRKDLIYLTDTYGVYTENFKDIESGEKSKRIYGGLDAKDVELLTEAKQQEKTIIGEYNSMASPTPKFYRSSFENIMGLKWTGWIARYYEELDTLVNKELPSWLIDNYTEQHGPWQLKGDGMIFVNESGEIQVLNAVEDYQNKTPLIRTPKLNKPQFNLPEVVPYPDWFDIVLIERDYEVISYFDLNPTGTGLEKLRKMGLPRFFPAAVTKKNGKGNLYYFSGDFSDFDGELGSPRFKGISFLWRGFYVVADYRDKQGFFWNYYLPLISQILDREKSLKSE